LKHRSYFSPRQMPILPVLDLMNGQIVRGIAGRRDEYRPIVSKWCNSADPITVALALREQFGFREFYLADLDAIQRGRLAVDIYRQLQDADCRLWIDAGIRSADDEALDMLLGANVAGVIVGLESLKSPIDLQAIVARAGAGHIVFSLDLKAGQPLGDVSAWLRPEPWFIAEHAIVNLGVRRLIVLDLARVGVGDGVGTEELCARLKQTFPDVHLTAGGGVRGIEDVKRLDSIGVDYVLVASALHDGRISRDDIR